MTKCRPTLSHSVGIGLRSPHVSEIAATRPELAFLEIHAENYMAETPALERLLELRRDYPVSLHGVALSLGSAEGLDRRHLSRFKALIERIEPTLVSEHLAWSAVGGAYLNDLLPLPYTEASLDLFCRHVEEAQEALGRQLLIENPSSYFRYLHSTIPEAEFLTEVAVRTGCSMRNRPLLGTAPFGLVGRQVGQSGHRASPRISSRRWLASIRASILRILEQSI